jgi:GINS complex subunit 2
MALPVSLRNSITPPELELVASEELVEIIPLISMERTAFISVRPALSTAFARCPLNRSPGSVWPPTSAKQGKDTTLDGHQSQDKKEMPHCPTRLAERRCVHKVNDVRSPCPLACTDFLQERLTQETSRPEFSQFPFRFNEIAKLLLDV